MGIKINKEIKKIHPVSTPKASGLEPKQKQTCLICVNMYYLTAITSKSLQTIDQVLTF